MKKLAIAFSAVLILNACSSEPEVIHLRTEKGQLLTKNPVKSNQILTIEIEGMTCEMGCGGSIRKELKATGGVERVSFDFIEGRNVQTAKISFDSNKISQDEMVKLITKMNDKQFKVGKISSENLESATATERAGDSEEEKVEISHSNFALPNLIDILAGIIQ